jgi:hypothetical protein
LDDKEKGDSKMIEIEMSLTSDYVPEWDVWEGLREIIQNARDAQIEQGAKMSVMINENNVLVVKSHGVTLPRESLLIGFSSKRNNPETMGQFGEGFKLGVLALVRAGHPVVIKNGDEDWIPKIKKSPSFDSHVLVFEISSSKRKTKNLQIEVSGIEQSIWDEFKKMFTFLAEPKQIISTTHGNLILDPEFAGIVFLKGIFVTKEPKFKYGYDLKNAKIDRDRRMIENWDLKWVTSRIWNEAVKKSPKMITPMMDLLQADADEVENMGYLELQDNVVDAASDTFSSKYGKNAVPVESISQSKHIEHFGKVGVVVPSPLVKVLEKKFGTYDAMKQNFMDEEIAYYSWQDLDDSEKEVLKSSIDLIAMVDSSISLDYFNIVKFSSKYTLGQHRDGNNLIARRELSDQARALRVIAHEWSHSSGFDGSFEFVDAVESLLAKVAIKCLGINNDQN